MHGETGLFWVERLSRLSDLIKLALGAATCVEGMQFCGVGTMYSDSIQVNVTFNLGYRACEMECAFALRLVVGQDTQPTPVRQRFQHDGVVPGDAAHGGLV